MIEKNENVSDVGFYVLPRTEQELTSPSPLQVKHRLSVIKEVSEDSSVSSTPAPSPEVKSAISLFQGYEEEGIQNMSCQQEIVLHTSGRGDGCSNLSSMR